MFVNAMNLIFSLLFFPSGHAKVTRPTPEMLSDCEPTAALTALQEEPTAVGAYDRIPFSAASLVFSLDTASQDMTLHAVHAEPVGGGVLQGTGTVGVSPQAETDPNALAVTVQAYGLPAEDLARRYLPEGAQLPPGILVGAASANATLKGAHLSPVIDVAFAAPEGGANGTARFTRTSTAVTLRSPYVDAVATVHVDPPSYEAIKAANTQAEATALAAPNVTGCDADVTMKGLDVVPLVSDDASLRQLAQQSGEPLRLKVNGRARVAGAVSSGKASPDASSAGGASPWKFAGTMDLEDLRLNQLKLYRGLKGNLELSENNVSVHARGLRADEVLDVDLSLPLLPGDVSAAALPSSGDAEGSPEAHTEAAAAAPGGSAVSVRCGQLVAAATVDAQGSQVDFRVANVHLDELELASLRGELQEVSCTLNFAAQTGRGRLSLTTPRYSGLGGESLSGGFRWERDVVRLEKLVLQQKHSKYEAQGEYVVPPSMPLPTSAADLARQQLGKDAAGKDATGRWRLRVDVPAADMQEILPAARLLQSAASQAPADYERAKTAFIEAVKTAALKASDLNAQLVAFAEKAAGIAGMPQSSAAPGARANSSSVAAPLVQLPALQDVRGNWSGSIQAFGGGGGATSCEFDVRGNGWQWGQASLDALVANGNYHSEEGVQLQEVGLFFCTEVPLFR